MQKCPDVPLGRQNTPPPLYLKAGPAGCTAEVSYAAGQTKVKRGRLT